MFMHRLKRLIGSFYHQKRIDIIITEMPIMSGMAGRGFQMR